MTIILSIETSSETASVALLQGNQFVLRHSDGVQTHSQTVLPMVQALLAEAGISLSRCDAIAFGAGPGSFTGVRTACGVAQGLAFGAGLPVVPVVTLEALAQACFEKHQTVRDVLAVLDARMGEVYRARYRWSDGWQTVLEPALASPADLLGEIAPAPDQLAVCGNAAVVYPDAMRSLLDFATTRLDAVPHAKQVAVLGQKMFLQQRSVAPDQAQPLYLRNKVAQTTAERQSRAAI